MTCKVEGCGQKRMSRGMCGKHYQRWRRHRDVHRSVPRGQPVAHGHAMSSGRSPTYNVWHGMRQRVLNPRNPAYGYYGGRGITICERWGRFENFLADMGERPEGKSLDRIDPDGDYEPRNCRWASPSEQRVNQRRATFLTPSERSVLAELLETDVAERIARSRRADLSRLRRKVAR